MTAFPEFPQNGYAFSSVDVGEALAGLVARDGSGVPVPGVLGGVTVSAVPVAWKVEVSPFTYVRTVGAGVGLSGLSAAEQHDIASAVGIPAGHARIDLVCWDPVGSSVIVVAGTVSASPVVPADGGLVQLALVRVNSGDGAVVAGQITHVFDVATLTGGSDVTVPAQLSGSPSWSGWFSFQPIVSVSFPKPFKDAPNLQATGNFSAEAVQLLQVTNVTATGFSARVIRFGHATPIAGTITYRASEK